MILSLYLPITKYIKTIKKKEFAKMTLNENVKAFVVVIAQPNG